MHGENDRTLLDLRQVIARMTTEEGLLYMLDSWLAQPAAIQLSWLEAGYPLTREFLSAMEQYWFGDA